jgi:hypothetical protein
MCQSTREGSRFFGARFFRRAGTVLAHGRQAGETPATTVTGVTVDSKGAEKKMTQPRVVPSLRGTTVGRIQLKPPTLKALHHNHKVTYWQDHIFANFLSLF